MENSQKPRLIVMPFSPDQNQAFDGTGLGIHFLLGNLFGAHPGLTECWFGWRIKKIFPDARAFAAYCRDGSCMPDFQALGKRETVRYWLTGRYAAENSGFQMSMRLYDIPGRVHDAMLPLSLDDGMAGFMDRLQKWLAVADLAFPRTDTVFWPERMTLEGLDCLGRGLETLYLNYITGAGADGDPIDLTWFERAVAASPRSYLARDLLGWALYKNQEIVGAASCFDTALFFNDKGVGALSGRLWCAVAQKDRKKALTCALAKARVTNADPEAARAWVAKKLPE